MATEPRRAARVVVVGAGIGGLVGALLLATQGVEVTLVEAGDEPGGKMRRLRVDGAAIDGGPTVLTMRWVFEQILEQAGASMADMPALTPLGVLARHAWRGHDRRLDLHADPRASVQAIGEFAGAEEARRFEAFCVQARSVYRALEGPYIRAPRPGLAGLAAALGPRGLLTLAGLGPFASLSRTLARQFRDPRLRQLFGRYATYCGASPWHAPATLMLVAHVELAGVWSVAGGMHALARAFADLAARRGVMLRYGSRCERIVVQGGLARGVRLASGEELTADALVFNGDPQALATGLLGADAVRAVPRLARAARSLSALTWAARVRTDGIALARHNVFFDDDYASEFVDIFERRRLPSRGTVYVCAQDRGDSDPWPETAPERLLCLVNAPPDGDRPATEPEEVERCETRSLQLLRDCGLLIRWQPHQVMRTTPPQFERLFPATGGALYGQATHGWMSSFRRPGSASAIPGLFLAGGGVHPGPGVPMAALSGQRAAAAVMAHLNSISRSRAVATAGGTSTRSATTVATP
jgi:1-hydroxycarotenoid 3,4-desaturase